MTFARAMSGLARRAANDLRCSPEVTSHFLRTLLNENR
jgi:hypothetical protein